MKTGLIPTDIEDALQAWYRGEASIAQLELGSQQLPLILQKLHTGDMPDGRFMHLQAAASGMRMDLLRLRAAKRLHDEGIE